MAASAVIGALRVNLGLNSASFRSGLADSQARTDRWGASIKTVFLAVSAAIAATATAIGAAVKGSINSADEMSKASQKFGVPIETLSKLAYAGEYADVSLEQLSIGIGKLTKNMGDIATGGGKEVAHAFDTLGISVMGANGNLRASEDVIYDIADRFAAMPNGVNKTAFAMQLFGKSGAQLIPLLNSGSAGLKAMGDEATRLGFALSGETGMAAEAFNDKLTKIGLVFTGLSNKLMVALLPTLNYLADKFVSAAEMGGSLDMAIAGISGALNILARALTFVFDHLQDLYDLFRLWIAAKIVLFAGSVAGSMITLAKSIKTVGITMALVTKITHAKITALLLLAAVLAKITGTYDTLVGWIGEFGNAVLNALPESVRLGIKDFGDELLGLGADIDAVDAKAAENIHTFAAGADIAGDSFGTLKKRVDSAADSVDTAKQKAEDFASRISDTFRNVGSQIRGLIDGTSSWNDVLMNVAQSLASLALSNIDFGASGSTGDLWGQLLKGFIGSNAGGSTFWRGGLTTVNEHSGGDEIIDLPRGSRIIPHSQVEGAMGSGQGAPVKPIFNFYNSPSQPEVRPNGAGGFDFIFAEIDNRLADGRLGGGMANRYGLKRPTLRR